jgi:hypothetical protein
LSGLFHYGSGNAFPTAVGTAEPTGYAPSYNRTFSAGVTPVVYKADGTPATSATWLSNSELVYTGNGKILHADIDSSKETSIPFTAEIHSIRPVYTHQRYDFDGQSKHAIKGIYAPALSPDGKQVAFIALNQL